MKLTARNQGENNVFRGRGRTVLSLLDLNIEYQRLDLKEGRSKQE